MPLLKSMSLVNLRNAGSFLDSDGTGKVEVFVLPSAKSTVNPSVAVPILDLYTGKEILYPVATVIVGGLISCTLLEFSVRPALFWLFGKNTAEFLANDPEVIAEDQETLEQEQKFRQN